VGEHYPDWVGRRVWVESSASATRRKGVVVHTYRSALEDIDLSIHLDDGSVTTVRLSTRDVTWGWDAN
jgi:hypothetical protein